MIDPDHKQMLAELAKMPTRQQLAEDLAHARAHTQQAGNHYSNVPGIPEAWDLIEALQERWPNEVRYHCGNLLKYVYRLGRKNGAPVLDDLKKVRDYADRAIKVLERGVAK